MRFLVVQVEEELARAEADNPQGPVARALRIQLQEAKAKGFKHSLAVLTVLSNTLSPRYSRLVHYNTVVCDSVVGGWT